MSSTEEKQNKLRRQISGQLLYERLAKGMSQEELAQKTGIKRSNISRIESGTQNLTLDSLVKITEAFEKQIQFVVKEEAADIYNVRTNYCLRIFDTDLINFSMNSGTEPDIEITWITDTSKHLLPLNMLLTKEGLTEWLKKRSIPQNRAFVYEILNALGLEHNNLKAIIDISKGLSLNDSYWIVPQSFTGKFANYNLYENNFDTVLSLIAYTGAERSCENFSTSPELTTGGMLRKAWRNKGNDGIWLYKGGTEDFANAGNEPFSEFYACQIAEQMGLNTVHYELENWKGILASKCRLFTNINTSYVPAGQIIKEGGLNACAEYYKTLGSEFYEQLCNMLVFDALIYNEDRHFGNFGVLRSNITGKIIAPAPIFDNGASLLCYAMKSDFEDLNKYIKTRTTPYGCTHTELAERFCGKEQKAKLRKLVNFKFAQSDLVNLPSWRTNALEELIQKRVRELLSI